MDFSFMKTGGSSVNSNNYDNTKDILNILELFTSNALKTSSRFVELCGRNGITNEDITYGLIYEVFEFFGRPNNLQELQDIELLNKNGDDDDDETEDIEDYIIDDAEIEDFGRIETDSIVDAEDREFVEKLYRYYDGWESWVPTNRIEQILQDAINKIYK